MKNHAFLIFGAIGLLAAVSAQGAGDAAEGKAKFYSCVGCHGIAGYSNVFPTYPVPRLGRQHKEVVLAALHDYKVGARKHGSMEGNANGLSDEDMDDIAVYLASQRAVTESSPISGNPSVGKAKAEACGGCHGADGNSAEGSIPRLAAQYEGYLVQALKAYRSGRRSNAIMSGMAASLSDQDISDVSAYYASQPNGLVMVRE